MLIKFTEVDCGDPNDIAPAGAVTFEPTTTQYFATTSNFDFSCMPGSEVKGLSEDGDTIVRCKANGRWDFGSLRCQGNSCNIL